MFGGVMHGGLSVVPVNALTVGSKPIVAICILQYAANIGAKAGYCIAGRQGSLRNYGLLAVTGAVERRKSTKKEGYEDVSHVVW